MSQIWVKHRTLSSSNLSLSTLSQMWETFSIKFQLEYVSKMGTSLIKSQLKYVSSMELSSSNLSWSMELSSLNLSLICLKLWNFLHEISAYKYVSNMELSSSNLSLSMSQICNFLHKIPAQVCVKYGTFFLKSQF
jgi:restriction endonuclease